MELRDYVDGTVQASAGTGFQGHATGGRGSSGRGERTQGEVVDCETLTWWQFCGVSCACVHMHWYDNRSLENVLGCPMRKGVTRDGQLVPR